MKTIFPILLLTAACCGRALAQNYDTNNVVVQTFAGSGFYGYFDGKGTQTMFGDPSAVVADTSGSLFVADQGNYRIRKITQDGTVSTFAGGGSLPTGSGTNVALPLLGSMTIDHSNVLWVVAVYAIGPNSSSLVRIGIDAYVATIQAGLSPYSGVCVDSTNNIYYSDTVGNKIYRLRTNGVLEVFAGSGNFGSADGNWIFTSFGSPAALAADAADNIYVWDSGTALIRRINQNRDVVTIAGNSRGYGDVDGVGRNASFFRVSAMSVDDSGNVLLACYLSIRRMTASTNVLTMAGSFADYGYTNGTGKAARFYGATGVCVSQGAIFVADSYNQRIRSITFNPQPEPVSGASLVLNTYPGLQITGVVGRSYRIESSKDLKAWQFETTLLLTSSPYLWLDQTALGQRKFYRAFLLP
jgi:hypothetical protein